MTSKEVQTREQVKADQLQQQVTMLRDSLARVTHERETVAQQQTSHDLLHASLQSIQVLPLFVRIC